MALPYSSPPTHTPTHTKSTFRGNYEGDEAPRLATLKYAALLGAPFIDVEYKASATFFASR